MSCITIVGGTKLRGELVLQGSKNATLPILAAAVLCKGRVVLKNCPDISDVRAMLYALSFAGVGNSFKDGVLELDTTNAAPYYFGEELAGKTRGGVLLLGACLGRFGEAGMAYPGGCVIGARPIDLHCYAFRMFRTELTETETGVLIKGVPRGARIRFPYPSVGATENAVLAAVCAKGRTVLYGAATEPEIADMCRFLCKAGAKIQGIGTSQIVIDGVSSLHGTEYTVSGDRIAAGTYMAAVAMTGGELLLRNTGGVCMKGINECFRKAGAEVYRNRDMMMFKAPKRLRAIKHLMTAPYPAFPTDMQSQTVAMLSVAKGQSRVTESVFESRFRVLEELRKMGAGIVQEGRSVVIQGKDRLYGAEVCASDLRSGAALVMAAVAAEGVSVVHGYEYIARGYEDICDDFCCLGANVIKTEEE